MNRPIIYFRCHYSFGRCKFYAFIFFSFFLYDWVNLFYDEDKRQKQKLHKIFYGVMEIVLNEMKWNEFLDFSSVFWWNLLKMNTNGHSNRYMHNSDLSCWFQWNKQHIIQHLQRRFAIIFFFFFFEQAQLYEVKHFFFLNFMRIEHELMNQAIHKIKNKAVEK